MLKLFASLALLTTVGCAHYYYNRAQVHNVKCLVECDRQSMRYRETPEWMACQCEPFHDGR